MIRFLAKRIHDGFMSLEGIPTKYQDEIKEKYKEMYGEDL